MVVGPTGERDRVTLKQSRHLWTFAGGLLLVIVAMAVFAYIVIRPRSTQDAGEVVGYKTPPPVAAASSSVAADRGLTVGLLRGGRTGCVDTGGCNDDNYDAWLKYLKGWSVTTNASGGTGYVAGNIQRPKVDYASRLGEVVRLNPKVVIVEGSVSDQRYSYDAVKAAAVDVYDTLRKALPNAKVIVVGPMWAGTPPKSIVSVERALKSAAAGRVIKFIDPIAEDWFAGANATLMGKDHVTPTNDGHRFLAQRIVRDLIGLNLAAAK